MHGDRDLLDAGKWRAEAGDLERLRVLVLRPGRYYV